MKFYFSKIYSLIRFLIETLRSNVFRHRISVHETAWMAVQSSELHRFPCGKSVHEYVTQTSCDLRLVFTYVSFDARVDNKPRNSFSTSFPGIDAKNGGS